MPKKKTPQELEEERQRRIANSTSEPFKEKQKQIGKLMSQGLTEKGAAEEIAKAERSGEEGKVDILKRREEKGQEVLGKLEEANLPYLTKEIQPTVFADKTISKDEEIKKRLLDFGAAIGGARNILGGTTAGGLLLQYNKAGVSDFKPTVREGLTPEQQGILDNMELDNKISSKINSQASNAFNEILNIIGGVVGGTEILGFSFDDITGGKTSILDYRKQFESVNSDLEKEMTGLSKIATGVKDGTYTDPLEAARLINQYNDRIIEMERQAQILFILSDVVQGEKTYLAMQTRIQNSKIEVKAAAEAVAGVIITGEQRQATVEEKLFFYNRLKGGK